ncbi:hypothetical protein Tco_0024066 [Tanacetum coccineum]
MVSSQLASTLSWGCHINIAASSSSVLLLGVVVDTNSGHIKTSSLEAIVVCLECLSPFKVNVQNALAPFLWIFKMSVAYIRSHHSFYFAPGDLICFSKSKSLTFPFHQNTKTYSTCALFDCEMMKRKEMAPKGKVKFVVNNISQELLEVQVDRGCGKEFECSIYCRDLDTIPLRDLIDYEGKLILEDPQPSVPRVGIPRPTEHLQELVAYNPSLGKSQTSIIPDYQQHPPPPPQYPPQYQ